MTDAELLDYQYRAIIGNIRNTVYDILIRPRPRVQYLHFWRGTYRKLEALLRNPELQGERREVLEETRKIFREFPKLTNSDSEALAKELGIRIPQYTPVPPKENN